MEPSKRLSMGVRVINLSLIYFIQQYIAGQSVAVAAYDFYASLGLHPARDQNDPVSVAVTQGIAFADAAIQ